LNIKLSLIGIVLIAALVSSGCAGNRKFYTLSSISTRNDVFVESSISEAEVGEDKSITDIVFSVKSLSSRFFETYMKHSDPPYRIYLNIDGQTTVIDSDPLLEKKSTVSPNTQESGTGWRYQFNKRIIISSGKHKLTISIPVDDVIVERDIELHPGVNAITLEPVYKKNSSQRPYKNQNFVAGLRTVEVIVN
jgi:hypothetical protein